MKAIITMLLAVLIMGTAKAQTWDEWFRQKKTQKKYLVQQIAALRVFKNYAKKGYDIAKDGLKCIGDFAQSEFDLHISHFKSLKKVSPKVKGYHQIQECLRIYSSIVKSCKNSEDQLQTDPVFSSSELEMVYRVHDRLLGEADRLLSELDRVITDGELEMSDSERLAYIGRVHQQLEATRVMSAEFIGSNQNLERNRRQRILELEVLRELYGIKK